MNTEKEKAQGTGIDYWTGEGGQSWVDNMERSEALIAELTFALMEKAAVSPGENILDVGCGGGQTSRQLLELASPGGTVLGLDVSDSILAVARERHGGVEGLDFLLGDAASVDLPSGEFDLLFSRFGVMFFEDPVGAFRHLRASLSPAGRLLFMCWRSVEDNPWMGTPGKAAMEVIPPAEPPDPEAPGPFAMGDPQRTTGILRDAGLQDIQLEPLEGRMHMGTLEEAMDFHASMGPVAGILESAEPDQAREIHKRVQSVLQQHLTAGEVVMDCGAWLVSARP